VIDGFDWFDCDGDDDDYDDCHDFGETYLTSHSSQIAQTLLHPWLYI